MFTDDDKKPHLVLLLESEIDIHFKFKQVLLKINVLIIWMKLYLRVVRYLSFNQVS